VEYEGKHELFTEAEGRRTKEQLMAYYALTEAQYERIRGSWSF
jgi:hypothetical protein